MFFLSMTFTAALAFAQDPQPGIPTQPSAGVPELPTLPSLPDGLTLPDGMNLPNIAPTPPPSSTANAAPTPPIIAPPNPILPQTVQAVPPMPAVPSAPPPSGPPPSGPAKSESVSSLLPVVQKQREPRVILHTSLGDIKIKLWATEAPMTSAHFMALAKGEKEYIDVKTSKRAKKPFYNRLTFHRVVKDILIQTGCPFGTGRGGPGDIAMVADEIRPTMRFNKAGLVAMAPMRDGSGLKNIPNTNGSQFFIALQPMPAWDGQFTIFGEIEEGLEIARAISNVKTGPTDRPIKRVFLNSIDTIDAVNGR